jgi:acyl-CoA hydrolase
MKMTEIELSSVKAGQFPDGPVKVTEANLTYVAIDGNGQPRTIPGT